MYIQKLFSRYYLSRRKGNKNIIMESLCIKTNNQAVINYLLNSIEKFNLDHIYFCNKQFKIYNNIIIHYLGEQVCEFYNNLADLLTDCIIQLYEPILIRKIVHYNYFYFSSFEKAQIIESCISLLTQEEEKEFSIRKEHLFIAVLKYASYHKSIVLDGFVNFRIQDYMKVLDEAIDYSVNKYLIEKEYSEFINLLRLYINSKDSQMNLIHLIYINSESILLDAQKNIISLTDHIFDAKYLSDISFSSNDYALNALLTLLPEVIHVHLIDQEDEFINTLKLIFEDRIKICRDCNICRTYKMISSIK